MRSVFTRRTAVLACALALLPATLHARAHDPVGEILNAVSIMNETVPPGAAESAVMMVPAPTVLVLSRREVERYRPRDCNETCISILSPPMVAGEEPQMATLSPEFAAVLRLWFVDADLRHVDENWPHGWLTPEMARESGLIAFDENHAALVVDFMARHPGAARVVVHCEMGGSRSPGVALGLADAALVRDASADRWPGYNRHVRETLATTARRRMLAG
ncbi:MAG TPA: hypothetical protein VF746_13290 [Longimicrobium sp.]|jgi:predicted protein tyrosine phosphatase